MPFLISEWLVRGKLEDLDMVSSKYAMCFKYREVEIEFEERYVHTRLEFDVYFKGIPTHSSDYTFSTHSYLPSYPLLVMVPGSINMNLYYKEADTGEYQRIASRNNTAHLIGIVWYLGGWLYMWLGQRDKYLIAVSSINSMGYRSNMAFPRLLSALQL